MTARSLALGLFLAAQLQALEVAGSDALVDVLGQAIGARVATIEKSRVRLDGTLPAREGLKSGAVDIALVLLREGDVVDKSADGKPIRRFPLGASVVYVYVHNSNPLREIDLGSLAAIYGTGQRGDFKFWSDLPGSNLSEPILAMTCSPDRQMAQSIFQGIALSSRAFKPSVRQRVEAAQARENIAARTNAILVSDSTLPENLGRALRVSDGREGRSTTPYSPDETNVFNGDYPLRIPLVLCVREDQVAPNRELIQWLLSEEVAARLRDAHFVPAPRAIRERLAQRLDSK